MDLTRHYGKPMAGVGPASRLAVRQTLIPAAPWRAYPPRAAACTGVRTFSSSAIPVGAACVDEHKYLRPSPWVWRGSLFSFKKKCYVQRRFPKLPLAPVSVPVSTSSLSGWDLYFSLLTVRYNGVFPVLFPPPSRRRPRRALRRQASCRFSAATCSDAPPSKSPVAGAYRPGGSFTMAKWP